MFDLDAVQSAITKFGMDGWLLCDFRGSNLLSTRVLGIDDDDVGSRRLFYFVGATGLPRKLVHRIEPAALDHLPGDKHVYLRWQELEEGIRTLVGDSKKIAMEYSPRNENPYVSKVDGGTLELVRSLGVDIVSSGNLIQYFESRWTEEQWQLHLEADRLNQEAFDRCWKMIADHVRAGKTLRETQVQQMVMDFYHDNNMETYHPPIIAVGPHGADPHYSPQPGHDAEIIEGSYMLLDMWVKLSKPGGVYSDLTKMGYVGTDIPDELKKVFGVVAAARDAGIALVENRFANGSELYGWEVDKATRDVIDSAGYGDLFCHRTGHNIGQETHGNGAHMDNLETKEDRLVMPQTCFSIEPGIYIEGDFGVRSEINVFVDKDSKVHVTGGLQTEVLPILSEY